MTEDSLHIDFEEYDLSNGLHVILHRDTSAPLVVVSVMYHVGSKNENPERTGFAHFFEHLMFEGSENIPRGKFFSIVQEAGGTLNANTSYDRTFYYEVFPSNYLATGLWLESERMMHALVDKVGIETQRSVVKEERRQRYDNAPYGTIVEESMKRAFRKHPYRWPVIGSMEHIDRAEEKDYRAFYSGFYVPQNAVLCVAGDFETEQAKEWISKYFSTIPKGQFPLDSVIEQEPELTSEIRDKIYDHVQLPAVVHLYRIPAFASPDYFAVQLASELLSNGNSSRLHKSLVDSSQIAVQVGSFPFEMEHPGAVLQFAIGNADTKAEELEKLMDEEVNRLAVDGLTQEEFDKLINQTETRLVNEKSSLLTIAEGLSTYFTYFKNTDMYNSEYLNFISIKKDDIQRVVQKYFHKNNRVALFWLPFEEN